MTDPQNFESGGDSTIDAADPTGNPTAVGVKFYQVSVPDFALNGGTTGGNSFIRLGSSPPATDPTPGFAASYAMVQSQVHLLTTNDTSWDPARLSDDAQMLTKGGVWEHTDGNRVVTTAGDKLEIIQGNYSLVVGGSDVAPVNTSVTAPSFSSLTGSEASPIGTGATLGSPTPPESMPMTVDLTPGDVFVGTWANRVLTYVGSSPKPVPVVFTETYSGVLTNNIYSTGDVNVLTQVTAGNITTTATTKAGNITVATNITGGTFTTANAIVGGTMMTNNEANAITTTNTAASINTINTALNNFTFTLGVTETINVGAIAAVNIGPQLVLNWPGILQFSIDDDGFHVTKTEATAASNRLATMETNISANKTAIDGQRTSINAMQTTLAGQATELSTQRTQINTLYDVLSGQILLA